MMRWSYAVLRPDGSMEMEFSENAPMKPERLKELLGGDYTYEATGDGAVAALRVDQRSTGLPLNKHFLKQGTERRGTIVLGKIDPLTNDWVGMLGVMVPE